MSRIEVTIRFSSEELQTLNRPVNGQGGFQSLLRKLQRLIAESPYQDSVTIGLDTVARICKYVKDTGQGGFQSRLYDIFLPMFDGMRNLEIPEERP